MVLRLPLSTLSIQNLWSLVKFLIIFSLGKKVNLKGHIPLSQKTALISHGILCIMIIDLYAFIGEITMHYMSVTDIQRSSKKLRTKLESQEEIVLTSNGQPFGLVIPTDGENVHKMLSEIIKIKTFITMDAMAKTTQEKGIDYTPDKIDAIIQKVRKEKNQKK